MSYRDKVAVVIGGTGGIGSAVTTRLRAEGTRVVVTRHGGAHSPKSQKTHRAGDDIREVDAFQEDSMVRLFDSLVQDYGMVHIVINTVGGYLAAKPIAEVTLEEWERMMKLNLTSSFLATREAIRRMQNQPYGRIINFSAMVGIRPTPNRIPYAVSKSGVTLLTELAAQECKGTGLTVNAIAPSIVATDANMASTLREEQRGWVKPDDIADLVLYLCSDAAAAISGTTIRAFGGY